MTNLDVLEQKVKDHIDADDEAFHHIKENISTLKEEIKLIRDNHLAHLKMDINELSNKTISIKSDVKWIKIVGGAIFVATLGEILNALFNQFFS